MPSSHALTLAFRDTRCLVITVAVAEMRTSRPSSITAPRTEQLRLYGAYEP